MLSTTLLLTFPFLTSHLATAQQVFGFPTNTFTIRPPEGCDKQCKDTLCTIPGVCLPCGTGMCTGDEECGTWAGNENYCCLHYGFTTDGSKPVCSNYKDYLEGLDIGDSSAGSRPTVREGAACPTGEVVAAYHVDATWGQGNLSCCPADKDAVVMQGEEYGIAIDVLCVPALGERGGGGPDEDLSGGENDENGDPIDEGNDEDGNPIGGGNGDGSGSGTGKVRVGIWGLPVVILTILFV
ncbi:hypothetical protein ABW19_dt0209817 [Dactylella cylindrospora]|nr:hypothetical protein ABW19_dt0209817 [Dactylella cylindrospora]